MKARAWIFALLLSVAPVLVAVITIAQTDIPKTNLFLGNLAPPINSWIDDLPVSIVPAVLLGIVGWLVAFIPTAPRFRNSHTFIKIIAKGVLVSLAFVVLWLGILFAHLWIVLKYWYAPMIGSPVLDPWIFIVGVVWTGGIILYVFLHSDKQLVQ